MLDGVRKLKAWQLAHQLVVEVYKVTAHYPREEMFGLTSQMRRAAVAVPANIVEGSLRQYLKEYVQFLYVAESSLGELEYHIFLSLDLGFMSREENVRLDALRMETAKTLRGLIKWLEDQMAQGKKAKSDLERKADISV